MKRYACSHDTLVCQLSSSPQSITLRSCDHWAIARQLWALPRGLSCPSARLFYYYDITINLWNDPEFVCTQWLMYPASSLYLQSASTRVPKGKRSLELTVCSWYTEGSCVHSTVLLHCSPTASFTDICIGAVRTIRQRMHGCIKYIM